MGGSDSVLNDYSRCRRRAVVRRSKLMASSHHSLQVRDRVDRCDCWMAERFTCGNVNSSSGHRRPHSFGRHFREGMPLSIARDCISLVPVFVRWSRRSGVLTEVAFRFRQVFACQLLFVVMGVIGCTVLKGSRTPHSFVQDQRPLVSSSKVRGRARGRTTGSGFHRSASWTAASFCFPGPFTRWSLVLGRTRMKFTGRFDLGTFYF